MQLLEKYKANFDDSKSPTNFPTKGLRSKRRTSSTGIFQVAASL